MFEVIGIFLLRIPMRWRSEAVQTETDEFPTHVITRELRIVCKRGNTSNVTEIVNRKRYNQPIFHLQKLSSENGYKNIKHKRNIAPCILHNIFFDIHTEMLVRIFACSLRSRLYNEQMCARTFFHEQMCTRTFFFFLPYPWMGGGRVIPSPAGVPPNPDLDRVATPPPGCEQSENITFPILRMRAVIIAGSFRVSLVIERGSPYFFATTSWHFYDK